MPDSDVLKPDEENVPELNEEGGDTSGFEAIAEEIRREQKNTKRKRVLIMIDTLLLCALAAAIAILVRIYIVTPLRIDGDSMETVLKDGDIVLLSKWKARRRDPKRYEIAVFEKPDDLGKVVKRVIALPGEVIYADSAGAVHVFKRYENGEYFDEVQLEEQYNPVLTFRGRIGTEDEPLILGDDEFFIMGDNRTVSKDSRYYGPFKRADLKGITGFRILPFSRIGVIEPK